MNLLSNWIDITLLSGSGWGGKKEFSSNLNALLLTATNGWQNWYWTIPAIENQNITIEFDYKFTNLDNWSECWITTTNSYGGTRVKDLKNVTDWTHYRLSYSSASTYIGINVRGVDNTGKSLTIAVKNIQLSLDDSFNSQIGKNGCVTTHELIEDTKPIFYKRSIYSNNIIEY